MKKFISSSAMAKTKTEQIGCFDIGDNLETKSSVVDILYFEKRKEQSIGIRELVSSLWGFKTLSVQDNKESDEEYDNNLCSQREPRIDTEETFFRRMEYYSTLNENNSASDKASQPTFIKMSVPQSKETVTFSDKLPTVYGQKNRCVKTSLEQINNGNNDLESDSNPSDFSEIRKEKNNDPSKQAESCFSVVNEEEKFGYQETGRAGKNLIKLNIRSILENFDSNHPDEDNESSLYENLLLQDVKTKTVHLFEEMKSLASSNGFEMKDCSANGNCMFQAMIDQLRINGDFGFTVSSLRHLAVQYLKTHPNNSDGTPLESFLEENWNTYLTRMSQSCQWGDHLVLKALCQVLKRKIIVYNAGNDDMFHQHELEPETEDRLAEDTLYLGHIGELHYLSLRPKKWKETWFKKAKQKTDRYHRDNSSQNVNQAGGKKTVFAKDLIGATTYNYVIMPKPNISNLLVPSAVDAISGIPLPHLNFLIKLLVESNDICPLKIPSKLVSLRRENGMATAGGRSDGTEVFVRIRDPSLHTTEFCQRYDYECPVMILYSKELEVVCDGKSEALQDHQVRAEIEKSHPGYCVLSRYGNQKSYILPTGVRTNAGLEDPTRALTGYFCPSWPIIAQEWKMRTSTSGWPSEVLRQTLLTTGCMVVSRHHFYSHCPTFEWQFIFSEAEKIIFRDGITNSQRYVYNVAKVSVDHCTKHVKRKLRTVHIKAAFLYICEKIRESSFETSPAGCFLYLVELMLKFLEEKNWPNYFVPDNNMIDDFNEAEISRLSEALHELRSFPIQSIFFMMQERGHYRSWILDIVEKDFERYKENPDLNRTITEVFFPLMIRCAVKLISEGKHEEAGKKLHHAHELLLLSPPDNFGNSLHVPDIMDMTQEIGKCIGDGMLYRLLQGVQEITDELFSENKCTDVRKLIKDFTGGKDVGGFGDRVMPKHFVGDRYLEADYLNRLGVILHNKERDYEGASFYYAAAIDRLARGKISELDETLMTESLNNSSQVQPYTFARSKEIENLAFIIFENLLMSGKQHKLLPRMVLLENICRRSKSPEGLDFVMDLWEELGKPDKGVEFYFSCIEH